MNIRIAAFGLAILPLWTVSGYAGPCSRQIRDTQIRIDAKLNERAATGPAALEGPSATLGHQPTPASMAAAETALGDVSASTVNVVGTDMNQARRADLAGEARRCRQALAAALRATTD